MTQDQKTAQLLDAVAAEAAFEGWTRGALGAALRQMGRAPVEATLFFEGPDDMIEAWFRLADDRLVERLRGAWTETGLGRRVKAALLARFELWAGEKEAARRAMAHLLLPTQAARLARVVAHMADSVWYAAEDRSADFSWYTKRAMLGGIILAALLYWIADHANDDEKFSGFLDRRLAGVARVTRLRQGLSAKLAWFAPRAA
ncbi:COQ9 family protein [Acidocella sp.]|uniref:COQ9 family protein n=1 Tax=Acidocella sp. TaxID=50710 RepID=UPI00261DFF3E|nr:COQ9 family protein [Acidocella sp.]